MALRVLLQCVRPRVSSPVGEASLWPCKALRSCKVCREAKYSTAPPLALPCVWPAIRENFKESVEPEKKKATEFQWVNAVCVKSIHDSICSESARLLTFGCASCRSLRRKQVMIQCPHDVMCHPCLFDGLLYQALGLKFKKYPGKGNQWLISP